MKKKINKNIGIFLLILVLTLLILLNLSGKKDPLELSINRYDPGGNKINQPLSVVNGIPEVYAIDLTITATNTGDIPLFCDIVSITPTNIDSFINKTTKILPSKQPRKVSWTSELIDINQFLPLSQPVTFEIKVRCYYMDNNEKKYLEDKSGNVKLSIYSEYKPSNWLDKLFDLSPQKLY